MKNIAAPAMAAIEAGEAIVTGAVDIFTRSGPPQVITTGTAVVLSWQQNTFIQASGDNDKARMGIAFLDVGGVQIGSTTWATFTAPTVWTARSVSASSPAGAAIVRLFQSREWHDGAHNDGYIDEIELTLGAAPVTLRNPGAEQGVAGWSNLSGQIEHWNPSIAAALFPGAPGGPTPAPAAGAYYFSGNGTVDNVAYQDYATYVAGDIIRVWGGHGPITIDGNTYQGLGDRALAQKTAGAIGGVAQGLTLTLSGIEAAALDLLDADEIRSAPIVLRRLIFACDGKTLLGHEIWDRGKTDTVGSDEVIGAAAAIQVAVESAARGLGRSGARQRSDSDQRLINPADGYHKNTAFSGEKELFWGGKKPTRTGSAVTGGTGSSSSAGSSF